MKTISLKLDEEIFKEVEEITQILRVSRNRYINEAVSSFNRLNKKELLKIQLARESALTSQDSMNTLQEF
jgi:predicted transcriptional regulator